MENKEKEKYSPKQILIKFGQFIYLSTQASTDNNLWETASACSYSFIFSFIPVIMIIFTVLVSVLRVSPELTDYVVTFCNQGKSIYDFWPLLENLLNKKAVSIFDFFLGIWVIWMARKLFLSIVQGMYKIFQAESPRQNAFNQLLTFICEFVLVLIFIVFILASFLFDKLINLSTFDFLRVKFPFIFRTLSNVLVSSVLYFMFFIFSLLSYKFISGTKPSFKICLFYALLNTGIIFIVSFFLNRFMNFSKYNVIYGTISTLVILLFKVYMFFSVFLFCAQMVYVSQFFDNLLISQLYVMQNKERNYLENLLSNHLFKNPSISHLKTKTESFQPGDIIFSPGTNSKYVYFIESGKVREEKNGNQITYGISCFFGEMTGFLNTKRNSTAIAEEYTQVICFTTSAFLNVIRQNHLSSTVALAKLNEFTKMVDVTTD